MGHLSMNVYDHPHRSSVSADGTIERSVSVWDADGHSSCVRTIAPDESEYSFWCWLLSSENTNDP